ncbi:MAG: hypothetical protein KME56_04620 [Candidatus Thiodiazotropha sp. (ex Ctena orbiculata)]|uniref:Uncharacterized protein n=1 Tax=Candidatus Thiodiazotropha taylori TaxID=2792791 RepID=A0A944QV95_9GAMM|nr:hypothetical protein [Candidatus Thiodiazotropha taylori]MBT2989764.1 hypothetical protein [Candidatus Thiodiazotropha taylori]MBT2995897.1 hypothetical protein [Candidatus Thiodiazotropha taylori]MBT2999212.1 hypothetical protein [Candidatus Thiodiazotropha taylori]MBT3026019.1 hypothetical protein [Candidatus Thiodiazotropha taylori]
MAMLWLAMPGAESLAEQARAGFLLYGEREAGGEEVVNRLLFTSDKLRIEPLDQAGGYILYHSEAATIYSVTPDERTILVIQPEAERVKIPDDMALRLERIDDIDAPAIGGSKPQHWRLTVNEIVCRDVILAPGLMTDQLLLYRDYLMLLAKQHYLGLDAIPGEYRDPCDDVVHVFAPALFLEKGLPIRIWDQRGSQQSLLDFSVEKQVGIELFHLPKDYHFVPMSRLQ